MCVFVRQHDKRENLLLTLTKVSRSHGHTTQTNPACEPIPNQSSLAGDAWLVQSPSTSSSVRTTVGALLPRAGWVEKYSARFVFFRCQVLVSFTDSFSYFSSLPQVVRGAASICFRGGGELPVVGSTRVLFRVDLRQGLSNQLRSRKSYVLCSPSRLV